MRGVLGVVGLAACLATGGCGKASFELPNRSDPSVQVEEQRVASLLAAAPSHGLLDSADSAHCRVRLLRRSGSTDYAWATCTSSHGAASAPVRVEGDKVTVAADGDDAGSSNALSRIFPADIVKAIKADETRYKP